MLEPVPGHVPGHARRPRAQKRGVGGFGQVTASKLDRIMDGVEA